MRLRTYPRTERLFRRLPRPTALSVVEWLLLALIAVQAARLVWILVTPVGPVGDWRPAGAAVVPAGGAAMADFDPFFRLSAGGGPAVVTSLNLKLHGVREDRATGRGSAIIALPDGSQRSFGVGEEIIPGVRLTQVGFESVTIDRGGLPEQIFLDQSEPAQGAQAAPVDGPALRRRSPRPPRRRGYPRRCWRRRCPCRRSTRRPGRLFRGSPRATSSSRSMADRSPRPSRHSRRSAAPVGPSTSSSIAAVAPYRSR
jgi:general secretion pathway protein C